MRQLGSCLNHLLKVVNDEEKFSLADVRGDPILRVKRLRNRLDHQRWVADCGEPDPDDAIGKPVGNHGRCLSGKPRLAGTAWPRESNEADAISLDECGYFGEFKRSANERGGRRRQLDNRCSRCLSIWGCQHGILVEDLAVEGLDLGAGLQAELLDERSSGRLVNVEGLRLPAGAVEGQHQLTAETLTQRVLSDELLKLRYQLRMMSKRNVRNYALLDTHEAQLLEALSLTRDSTTVRQIAECRATPECKPISKRIFRCSGLSLVE